MSRADELTELERAFAAGEVSAEVATKRAAQLLGGFRKDWHARGRAIVLWNRARNTVAAKQKRSSKRRKPYRAH